MARARKQPHDLKTSPLPLRTQVAIDELMHATHEVKLATEKLRKLERHHGITGKDAQAAKDRDYDWHTQHPGSEEEGIRWGDIPF